MKGDNQLLRKFVRRDWIPLFTYVSGTKRSNQSQYRYFSIFNPLLPNLTPPHLYHARNGEFSLDGLRWILFPRRSSLFICPLDFSLNFFSIRIAIWRQFITWFWTFFVSRREYVRPAWLQPLKHCLYSLGYHTLAARARLVLLAKNSGVADLN